MPSWGILLLIILANAAFSDNGTHSLGKENATLSNSQRNNSKENFTIPNNTTLKPLTLLPILIDPTIKFPETTTTTQVSKITTSAINSIKNYPLYDTSQNFTESTKQITKIISTPITEISTNPPITTTEKMSTTLKTISTTTNTKKPEDGKKSATSIPSVGCVTTSFSSNYDIDYSFDPYDDDGSMKKKNRKKRKAPAHDSPEANDFESLTVSPEYGCPNDEDSNKNDEYTQESNNDGASGSEYDDNPKNDKIGKQTAFGVLIVTSLMFMTLQIYSSFFGHRMLLHPLRWHTIHYNCWNIFQLIIFANTDENSPYVGFLHNANLESENDSGVTNLQKLTFVAFMSSWIVILPFQLIAYFKPKLYKNRYTQWVIWIPIYAILNIIPITLCFAWNYSSRVNDVFGAYHMGITVLYIIFLWITIIFTIVALIIFIVHMILYCMDYQKHRKKFHPHAYDFLHLVFKLFYYIVSFYTIMPYNTHSMQDYLFRILDISYLISWAIQHNLMPTLMDIYREIQARAAWCAVMIPIGEFFTTVIWIEMYREQYVWMITCGRFYTGKPDKYAKKLQSIETRQPLQTNLPISQAPAINRGWTEEQQANLSTNVEIRAKNEFEIKKEESLSSGRTSLESNFFNKPS